MMYTKKCDVHPSIHKHKHPDNWLEDYIHQLGTVQLRHFKNTWNCQDYKASFIMRPSQISIFLSEIHRKLHINFPRVFSFKLKMCFGERKCFFGFIDRTHPVRQSVYPSIHPSIRWNNNVRKQNGCVSFHFPARFVIPIWANCQHFLD